MENYEWPACFLVAAETAELARQWGDTLAHSYCGRHTGLRFLRSNTEPIGPWDRTANIPTIPVVLFGREATDEEIGW